MIIYKYPLEFGKTNTVPDGSIIHFGKDGNGQICAWIALQTEEEKDEVGLYIIGTGMPFDDDHILLLSFVDEYGYVWHLIMDWTD